MKISKVRKKYRAYDTYRNNAIKSIKNKIDFKTYNKQETTTATKNTERETKLVYCTEKSYLQYSFRDPLILCLMIKKHKIYAFL